MAYEFHFFEAIQNEAGDALPGYFAQVVDPVTLAVIPIAADASGTPVVAQSGYPNMAKSDAYGNMSFWVSPGTFNLMIYRPDAQTFVLKVDGYPMGIGGPADLAASAFAARDAAQAAQAAAEQAAGVFGPLLAALPNLPTTATINALMTALRSQNGPAGKKQSFDWNGGVGRTLTESATVTGITGVVIDGIKYETSIDNFTINLGTKTVTPTSGLIAILQNAQRWTIEYSVGA